MPWKRITLFALGMAELWAAAPAGAAMGLDPLLAPLLVGSPLGAAFGLFLGAPPRRLLPWLAAGSVPWTMVFSLLAFLGKQLI